MAAGRLNSPYNPRDLSMVTESGDIIVAPGRYTVSIGGGQPGTEAPSVSAGFDVRGQITLPRNDSWAEDWR